MTDAVATTAHTAERATWPATAEDVETLREAAELIGERAGQGRVHELGFADVDLAAATKDWLLGEYTGLKSLPGWVALTQKVIGEAMERSGREYVRLIMARDEQGRLQYRSDTLVAALRVARRLLDLAGTPHT